MMRLALGRFIVPLSLKVITIAGSPERPRLAEVEDLGFDGSDTKISFRGDLVLAFGDFRPPRFLSATRWPANQ